VLRVYGTFSGCRCLGHVCPGVTSIADSPKLILAVARRTHTYQDSSGLLEQVTSREAVLIPISVSLPRPEPPLL
jgi:hypothetical protein